MPTNRRHRLKRRQQNEFTETQIRYLITGTDMSFADENQVEPGEAWPTVRESLLPVWIKHHPGRRPWAWWKFDAPTEPRNRVHDDGPPGLPEKGLDFGIPSGFAGYWPGVDMGELYESEAEYLDRFGLLAPGECERCDETFVKAGTYSVEFMAEALEACAAIDLNDE